MRLVVPFLVSASSSGFAKADLEVCASMEVVAKSVGMLRRAVAGPAEEYWRGVLCEEEVDERVGRVELRARSAFAEGLNAFEDNMIIGL